MKDYFLENPETVQLSSELVLKCTIAIWAVRRVNEYRDVLGQPKLDMTKPFLIPLPDDTRGLIIRDRNQKFLFANGNRDGSPDLPVDGTSYDTFKVRGTVEIVSERRLYFREECHVLYQLLEQAYFDMLYSNRITIDTYVSARDHWLSTLKILF